MKAMRKKVVQVLACAMMFTAMTGIVKPQTAYAASNSVVVATQKQLDQALADKKIKKITIKTTAWKTFAIKEANYASKELVIDGEYTTISNAARFGTITIKDTKVYKESAKNNKITVSDDDLDLIVRNDAVVKKLIFAKKDAVGCLRINGIVKEIDVAKKMKLLLCVNTDDATKVKVNAEDVTIISILKLNIETSHDMEVLFDGKNATDSKITITSEDAQVDVSNLTNSEVYVTDGNGDTQTLQPHDRITTNEPDDEEVVDKEVVDEEIGQ